MLKAQRNVLASACEVEQYVVCREVSSVRREEVASLTIFDVLRLRVLPWVDEGELDLVKQFAFDLREIR
jgi:hypothetical protein